MANSLKDRNCDVVSKRWAKALMELVQEQEGISKQDVLDDLREIENTINSSDELANVINNPSISIEEKQIVLCKLFQNSLMPIVYNFLYVLNLRKRVTCIAGIANEFEKELDVLNNVAHISVTSAIDLDDLKKEDIKNRIGEKLNKNVDVDWNVDNEIIAGLIFNINETIIDNSIRHRLDDLTKNIMKG